ncbi:MAG: ABC transporter ATP-binding protein [Corynebacterium sp.]|uniref:ABC transporter ATP-binding protein n=1 Tax=Corynebacterium sp. TaxID=1720 RepID=UPI0026DD8372|nr:ABC transporter ATP-binding protein [Corynebacterium sp.]MDO4761729.1 ABC transporter ATP-binding protein [Corynebacterium sp.]
MNTRTTASTVIETINVTKTFRRGKVIALQGINLRIQEGEMVAIVGKNGAGKTTLFDIFLGLAKPTHGKITLFGLPPATAIAQGLVGALHQTGGLLPDVTAQEIVTMIASLYPHPRDVNAVLEQCNLKAIASRKVCKCSGGEKQRIKLAAALVGNPKLIVLDEPTSGMDPQARQLLWDSLNALSHQGLTIVFSTHYLKEAEDFASRIILLDHGLIRATGAPHEALSDHHPVIVEFNTPSHNLDEKLPEYSGVTHWETTTQGYRVFTHNSDSFAREILNHPDVAHLRIRSRSLDEIFAEEGH